MQRLPRDERLRVDDGADERELDGVEDEEVDEGVDGDDEAERGKPAGLAVGAAPVDEDGHHRTQVDGVQGRRVDDGREGEREEEEEDPDGRHLVAVPARLTHRTRVADMHIIIDSN